MYIPTGKVHGGQAKTGSTLSLVLGLLYANYAVYLGLCRSRSLLLSEYTMEVPPLLVNNDLGSVQRSRGSTACNAQNHSRPTAGIASLKYWPHAEMPHHKGQKALDRQKGTAVHPIMQKGNFRLQPVLGCRSSKSRPQSSLWLRCSSAAPPSS